MTNTFFLLQESPIYTCSQLRKGIFPSQPCRKANLFKKCSDRESEWLRLYGLMYIHVVCSEQKNASQKPSVVVYNIGCQKGFIQLEVLEMYKITVAYIYTVSTSQEKSQTEHPFKCLIHSPAFACSLYIIYLSTIRIQSNNQLPSPSSLCNMLKSPISLLSFKITKKY